MENPDRLEALLTEIRNLVREQTDLYRDLATRSIAQQEEALRGVAAAQRLQRRALLAVAILLALLAAWIFLGAFLG
jgi:hypothetical protein